MSVSFENRVFWPYSNESKCVLSFPAFWDRLNNRMDSCFAHEILWVWLTFGEKSIPSFSSSSVIGLIGLSHFSWAHFGTLFFLTVVLCQSVQGFGISSLVVVVRRHICVVSTSGLFSWHSYALRLSRLFGLTWQSFVLFEFFSELFRFMFFQFYQFCFFRVPWVLFLSYSLIFLF